MVGRVRRTGAGQHGRQGSGVTLPPRPQRCHIVTVSARREIKRMLRVAPAALTARGSTGYWETRTYNRINVTSWRFPPERARRKRGIHITELDSVGTNVTEVGFRANASPAALR
jgi:hypothetical protein